MMHNNDFVVSLRSANSKRAYREYNIISALNCKSGEVTIPYDQEYEIYFKNLKNVKRKIIIEIDGTEIGEWIIAGNTATSLERFQNCNKRFKVVRLTDLQINDPTNEKNGEIVVKVYEEKVLEYYKPNTIWPSNLEANEFQTISYVNISDGTYEPLWEPTITYCATTCDQKVSNVAATGEGSISNQQFTKVYWSGSDISSELKFEFKIFGIEKETIRDFNFCPNCGNEARNFNFCPKCGKKLK
jgi:hypothetical protein